MDYTIEFADITDIQVESDLRHLIKAAFKSDELLPPHHLQKNISSHASQPSFFLVARENNQVIGCNAFLANDFTVDGQHYVGYQSCWSATHPDHQGKKVFVTIINEAKRILKAQGAGFLYGIPNNTSHPIFIKKLGFSETPAMMSRIFNIPFFDKFFFANRKITKTSSCFVDEEQVRAHKHNQSPDAVKEIRYNNSKIWGKYSTKSRYGLNIPYFEVGGIQLSEASDLKFLIKEVFSTYKPWFVQIISCQTNTFNGLLKNWQAAHMNGFIFYNLNVPEFKNFDIMIGTIDVF